MVKDRIGSKEYQSFVRQDRIRDTYEKETSNLEIKWLNKFHLKERND